MEREFDLSIKPLPCCAEAARKRGLEPSMDIQCQSCADYRSYLHDVRKSTSEVYRPGPDFEHVTWRQQGLGDEEPQKPKRRRRRG